jgi:hypothetical protein
MTGAAVSEDESQHGQNFGAKNIFDSLSSCFAAMLSISAIGAVGEALRIYVDSLNDQTVLSALMTNIFGLTSFVIVPLIWVILFGGAVRRFRWKCLCLLASFPIIVYLPVYTGVLIYGLKKCAETPGCGM